MIPCQSCFHIVECLAGAAVVASAGVLGWLSVGGFGVHPQTPLGSCCVRDTG